MLQNSAGSGNLAIVETLIEVGADVNKDPPDLRDIREPGPYRALWMTANAEGDTVELRHIQTARVLLENGADMNLQAGEGRNEETALQAAQRKGNAELLALLAKFDIIKHQVPFSYHDEIKSPFAMHSARAIPSSIASFAPFPPMIGSAWITVSVMQLNVELRSARALNVL